MRMNTLLNYYNLTKFFMDELKILPTNYKNKGITFNLLDRTDKAAIYESDKNTFEVFEVIIAEASIAKFGGKETPVPRREVMPGDEKFGKNAFAFQSRDCAFNKFGELK